MNPLRLGEILIAQNALTEQELERALLLQQRTGGRLGAVLIRIGAISEDTLLDVLSGQLSLPILGDAQAFPKESDILRGAEEYRVPLEWLVDQQILFWRNSDEGICYTAKDPVSRIVYESLRYFLGNESLRPCLAKTQDIERLVENLSREISSESVYADDDVRHLRELAEEAPIVELVNNILAQASEQRASDVHIEPEERRFFVRYRIDGVLYLRMTLGKEKFNAVVSRIKLISGMDIAERRLPQDGRLSTRVSGQDFDVRVSALPGIHGESIVMRLLPKQRRELSLSNLGMEADHLAVMKTWAQESDGIVLVTGPTGSGKSTTLYAALDDCNDGLKKIVTVEDPVEFQLHGITQIQTHAEIGMTFANALRSILRQDPDVIMIGEIRDRETAEIAIQSALTGHLVLSTLHTNDAISAFTRLIDMGVEPFLVATPLKAVQAQRLVRRLCEHCAQEYHPPNENWADAMSHVSHLLNGVAPKWRRAVGCPSCQNSGYRGRVGIYELISVSEEMQHLIVSGASVNEMKALARREGWRNLREDGFLKAYQGLTTIEEILRTVGN